MKNMMFLLIFMVTISNAKFGVPPKGWNDIKFGLVSNGIPYDKILL